MSRRLPQLLLILAIAAGSYLPVLDNGLTNWDDDKYVVNQPQIRELSLEPFTSVVEGNYHPLTMISLAFDYAIGGLNPRTYHATNLVLHLLNTALVFWLALSLLALQHALPSPRRQVIAGITALLFGVHTMHVESVAWVAERKDVLYGAFFFSSLIAYAKYLETRRRSVYALALVLFVAALLSKAMAVSLAVTLFAVDYLAGRRITRAVLLEKVPFLALGVIAGLVAAMAQRTQGAVVPEGVLSWHERGLVACAGLVHHITRLAVPVGLSPFYAYPGRPGAGLPIAYWLAPLVVALAAGVVWACRRVRLVVFSATFFFLNVALVLQFFPVGSAPVADRYVYVASLAFFLLLGAAFEWMARQARVRVAAVILMVAYAVGLSVATYRYASTWRDSLTLWSAVISHDPPSPLPYYNRGSAFLERRDYAAAERDLSRAIELNPRYAEAYQNRGAAKKEAGELDAALADFTQALIIKPEFKDALLNAGNLLVILGRYAEAADRYTQLVALETDPAALVDLKVKRAIARYLARDYRNAIADVVAVDARDSARALDLLPGFAEIDLRQNREACPAWREAAAGASVARAYASQHCQ